MVYISDIARGLKKLKMGFEGRGKGGKGLGKGGAKRHRKVSSIYITDVHTHRNVFFLEKPFPHPFLQIICFRQVRESPKINEFFS